MTPPLLEALIASGSATVPSRRPRQGIKPPKFADQFFKIDLEAEPMPALCLFPIPEPVSPSSLELSLCGLDCKPRSIPWPGCDQLPRYRLQAPIICQIFNWSEVVEWEGVRLGDFLDFVGLDTHPEGYFTICSRDGVYFEGFSRNEVRDPRVLLATGLNGEPLPEVHGGPLRLVVPFLQGYKSVKWVGAIRATRHDPMGIKRLLGQSKTGRLAQPWRDRYHIAPPAGRSGDPV